MGNYVFETITAAQALCALPAGDTQRLRVAPADEYVCRRAGPPAPKSERLAALKRPKVRLR